MNTPIVTILIDMPGGAVHKKKRRLYQTPVQRFAEYIKTLHTSTLHRESESVCICALVDLVLL
jgi:hypothetical protein